MEWNAAAAAAATSHTHTHSLCIVWWLRFYRIAHYIVLDNGDVWLPVNLIIIGVFIDGAYCVVCVWLIRINVFVQSNFTVLHNIDVTMAMTPRLTTDRVMYAAINVAVWFNWSDCRQRKCAGVEIEFQTFWKMHTTDTHWSSGAAFNDEIKNPFRFRLCVLYMCIIEIDVYAMRARIFIELILRNAQSVRVRSFILSFHLFVPREL